MAWTAVALSVDVERGAALPVILQGQEIALWRSASGAIQAWEDRCPHRGMRLSFGFVRGEELACLYHGWRFGTDGGCRAIPAHPDLDPPRTIAATGYRAHESGGFVLVDVTGGGGDAPSLPDADPVRSLTVRRSLAVVERILDAPDARRHGPVAALPFREASLTVALHAVAPEETAVHVCAPSGSGADVRLAAAAWTEDLRRTLERTATLPPLELQS